MERWKQHPGTGLYVSDLGRVAPAGSFLPPPRVLAVRDVGGHLALTYQPPGERKSRTRMVARLVLETWVGPPPDPHMVARTRDGNPSRCVLTNLLWGRRTGGPSPRPAEEDGGRRPLGAPRALVRSQERELRRELADGVPVKRLADRYRVSIRTIYRYKKSARVR